MQQLILRIMQQLILRIMQQLGFLCQSCALHTVHTGRVDMISIFVIISKNLSITNRKICASSLPLREKTIYVRKN